jgi:hypothetical protein
MGDPVKAMLVRPVAVGGRELAPGTPVWCHRSATGVEIEHHGKRARVDADAVVDAPVRGASLDQLRELDACFGLPPEAFEVEHEDTTSYYSIARCKHGRRFLRDLRGGAAMYETTTLLDDSDDGPPGAIWRRYHAMPIDWLLYLGRTG